MKINTGLNSWNSLAEWAETLFFSLKNQIRGFLLFHTIACSVSLICFASRPLDWAPCFVLIFYIFYFPWYCEGKILSTYATLLAFLWYFINLKEERKNNSHVHHSHFAQELCDLNTISTNNFIIKLFADPPIL